MWIFSLEQDPISWQVHRGYGRKSYNPLFKEKESVKWLMKMQLEDGFEIIEDAVKVEFDFYIAYPRSWSKRKVILSKLKNTRPVSRPDCTNMQKFLEDCLTGVVIYDDSLVVDISSRKWYAEKSCTIIKVTVIPQNKEMDHGEA